MKEKIQEIAARIRELREIAGLSLETVAEKLRLPVETYRTYEEGQADIPVGALYDFARLMGVDMTVLLTGREPKTHIFAVTRKDKGVQVERRRQYKYQSLAYHFVHKKAEPFLVTVDPKPEGSVVPRNSHPGQEFDYVLEGRLEVLIHDHALVLEEGDSVYYDSSHPHAMRALDGKPAKFLAIIF